MLLAMAWRNLWRQPVRTSLSLLSITFAATLLVFMLSFQLGAYATMKANVLRILDGFAQIQPQGYSDDPDIRKVIDAPYKIVARATSIPGVTAGSPRASSYVILANGELTYGAAIIGVDPERELHISTLAATVHKGRYLHPDDTDAIYMGDTLAHNLELKLGDNVTLLGSATDGTIAVDKLKVIGIFHTGMSEIDREVAETPLTRFQHTFGMDNKANTIVLIGSSVSAINGALPRLRSMARSHGLTVQDWGALQPALKQAITLDFSTSILWYVSLVVVVVFIILNTLMMTVLERTREFGMLLAIGMRSNLIGRMLWYELVFLVIIGNAIGIAIGGGTALWFELHGILFSSVEGLLSQWGLTGRIYPNLSPISALAGPTVIVLSVAIAGVIPYHRISRLEPITAMGTA